MSSTILAQFAIAIYCRTTHSRFTPSHFFTCHMSQVCQACNMFRFLIFFAQRWLIRIHDDDSLFIRWFVRSVLLYFLNKLWHCPRQHLSSFCSTPPTSFAASFWQDKKKQQNCNRSVKWSQNNHNNDYDGDCNAKWMDGWMAGWMNESLREWVNWKSGSRGGRTKFYMEVRKCLCVWRTMQEDNYCCRFPHCRSLAVLFIYNWRFFKELTSTSVLG